MSLLLCSRAYILKYKLLSYDCIIQHCYCPVNHRYPLQPIPSVPRTHLNTSSPHTSPSPAHQNIHISSIRYTIIIPIHNISTRSNIQMSLEAHNSHSQRAKVYKRKKSKAHTRRGARRYQYNLPKHPRHEQHMRSVWRLVADSNNVDIGAVGISTPAMQCDRRAVRIVLKRGWG